LPPLSPLALAVFLATVAAVAAAFVASVGWWARPAGESAAVSRRWRVAALALLVPPLALPAALAQAGLLARLEPPPPPAVLLLVALTLATVVLAFSPLGTRLALGVGLAGLVGTQAFRIPVEWFLHRAFAEGVVPVQMTWAGLNFDVLTGASALALGVAARRRALPRTLVLAWNLAGLALLANIVTIAVLSLPLPFRRFPEPPANLLPLHFPAVWLPSFLVQAALFGHLLVFRKLRLERHA
jgi:hypothetical protein